MAVVYAFLADGLEEVECLATADVLIRAGVKVKLVSITGKKRWKGAHGFGIHADALLHEVDPMKADLLFLPGGMPGTKKSDGVQTALRCTGAGRCCWKALGSDLCGSEHSGAAGAFEG